MCNRKGNPKAKPAPRKRAVLKAVKPKAKKCLPGYDTGDEFDEDDSPDGTEFDKAPEE